MLLSLLLSFYFVEQSTQIQYPYGLLFGVLTFQRPNFEGDSVESTIASVGKPIDPGGSFLVVGNAVLTLTSTSDNTSVTVWNSATDTSTLPLPDNPVITNIQAICSPRCAGAGTCNQYSPVCACPSGFSGAQCQSCAEGHFGPTCQACPKNCKKCDQGMSGSGRCLDPTTSTTKCDCKNGRCGSNGKCTCLPGYGPSSNGTACAECLQGFYRTSKGGCQTCQLGCSSCVDGTGECVNCEPPYTPDPIDKTKCDAVVIKVPVECPEGSFYDSNSGGCTKCAADCSTCTGEGSQKCIVCAQKLFMRNGNCVPTDENGVCEGTDGMMIGDNNRHQCEGCGVVVDDCETCIIPGFTGASIITKAECTGCLPGRLLSKGKCVEKCPSNSFASKNSVCTECSSPCVTCAEDPDHCLSCSDGQFASSGECVDNCPHGTFASKNTCIKCHPDCKTCKGSSYSQCSSCPSERPVKDSGRCLPTCTHQTQFFNKKTSTCEGCDPSCSSCSGPGPAKCLSCAFAFNTVRNGTCTPVAQFGPFPNS